MITTTEHSEQAQTVHVERDDEGRVRLAVDHPTSLERELARIVEGDDAAAVAAMSGDAAVRLAFRLLTAAGRDPLDVARALLKAADGAYITRALAR